MLLMLGKDKLLWDCWQSLSKITWVTYIDLYRSLKKQLTPLWHCSCMNHFFAQRICQIALQSVHTGSQNIVGLWCNVISEYSHLLCINWRLLSLDQVMLVKKGSDLLKQWKAEAVFYPKVMILEIEGMAQLVYGHVYWHVVLVSVI